ncbi:MAG: hypothetical protein HRU09_12765 [Oligoflexales bacterium]|nr:hypothetical protein [Oligoflexales bacterium]
MDSQNQKEIKELAIAVGQFIEWWGFRNIDGRIWAVIFLSTKAVSAADLISCLGVSKSLVSRGINELLEHKLIVKEAQIEHGTHTYRCCDDVGAVVRKVLVNRELKMLDEVLAKIEPLSHENNLQEEKAFIAVDPKKLMELKQLTYRSKLVLDVLLATKFKTLKEWGRVLKCAHMFLKKNL